MGVVEGEQEGGAMPAPAEGPAQGGAAEVIYDRRWGWMAAEAARRLLQLALGDAELRKRLVVMTEALDGGAEDG